MEIFPHFFCESFYTFYNLTVLYSTYNKAMMNMIDKMKQSDHPNNPFNDWLIYIDTRQQIHVLLSLVA